VLCSCEESPSYAEKIIIRPDPKNATREKKKSLLHKKQERIYKKQANLKGRQTKREVLLSMHLTYLSLSRKEIHTQAKDARERINTREKRTDRISRIMANGHDKSIINLCSQSANSVKNKLNTLTHPLSL